MVILPIDEPFNVSNPPYEDTLSIVGGPSISGRLLLRELLLGCANSDDDNQFITFVSDLT
jgi:hypothetical protein